MTKQIFKGIGIILLSSFFAYALYPKPKEIISLFVAGLMPLLLFALTAKKIEKAQLQKGTTQNKIIYYGFQSIFVIYVLAFLLVFRVSWFEKKLTFNFFQTARGEAYVLIALGVLALFLSYSGIFYMKHRRWPKNEDFGFKDKSRNLNPKEIKILVSVVLLLLLSMFGWIMYFIFSGKWNN
jgi:NADH:ubiquinone oxidoreductase subunit 5 (subunit L)/multisubunit Na+/H+ antiporter MnhA subunit